MAEEKKTPPKGKPHTKQKIGFAKAAAEGRDKYGNKDKRFSVEEMRKNMSTGGGEPIPAGHKWTNERRVLQPRNPETGQFAYNADAQMSLKYRAHGRDRAVPIALQNLQLYEGIKKGQKIIIGDEVWIAIRDYSYEELHQYFSHFDEKKGEYYSTGQTASSAHGDIWKSTTLTEELDAKSINDGFVKKQGRVSKEEKEAMAKGERFAGEVDLSKLGGRSQKQMQEALASYAKGFKPHGDPTLKAAKIGIAKKAWNQAYNEAKDAAGWVAGGTPPRPFRKGYWRITPKAAGALFGGGTPAVAGAGAGSSASPKSGESKPASDSKPSEAKPAEEKPAESKEPLSADRSKKVRETFGNISEAKSNPGKYLSENKGMLTSLQQALKEQAGIEKTLDEIVTAIAGMTEEQLADFIE